MTAVTPRSLPIAPICRRLRTVLFHSSVRVLSGLSLPIRVGTTITTEARIDAAKRMQETTYPIAAERVVSSALERSRLGPI
jgi:hypothetical protein